MAVENNHLHNHHHHGEKHVLPFHGKNWSSHIQDVIEVVCRVALTVFGFVMNPIATGIGFGLGALYGSYVGYKETRPGATVNQCDSKGGCGAGFLEELSGVRFPKAFNTIVAFGLTLEHLLHGCGSHSHIHLPFNLFGGLAGLSSGAWISRSLWHLKKR